MCHNVWRVNYPILARLDYHRTFFRLKYAASLSKQIIYLLSVGGIVPLYHLLALAEFVSMSHLQ